MQANPTAQYADECHGPRGKAMTKALARNRYHGSMFTKPVIKKHLEVWGIIDFPRSIWSRLTNTKGWET